MSLCHNNIHVCSHRSPSLAYKNTIFTMISWTSDFTRYTHVRMCICEIVVDYGVCMFIVKYNYNEAASIKDSFHV